MVHATQNLKKKKKGANINNKDKIKREWIGQPQYIMLNSLKKTKKKKNRQSHFIRLSTIYYDYMHSEAQITAVKTTWINRNILV